MKVIAALPVLFAFLVGALPAHAWTWPVEGPVLRPFSLGSDPYAAGQHRGIDIGAPPGNGVRAPAAGVVSHAGTVPRHGRTLTIATTDGYAVTLVQLGSIAVSRGASVEEGATVGTIGPSGEPEHAEGYVHLGVRVSADPHGYIDPLSLLPAAATGSGDPRDGAGAEEPGAAPSSEPAEHETAPEPVGEEQAAEDPAAGEPGGETPEPVPVSDAEEPADGPPGDPPGEAEPAPVPAPAATHAGPSSEVAEHGRPQRHDVNIPAASVTPKAERGVQDASPSAGPVGAQSQARADTAGLPAGSESPDLSATGRSGAGSRGAGALLGPTEIIALAGLGALAALALLGLRLGRRDVPTTPGDLPWEPVEAQAPEPAVQVGAAGSTNDAGHLDAWLSALLSASPRCSAGPPGAWSTNGRSEPAYCGRTARGRSRLAPPPGRGRGGREPARRGAAVRG